MAEKQIVTVDYILLAESIGYNELAAMPYVRGELPWDVSRKEHPELRRCIYDVILGGRE